MWAQWCTRKDGQSVLCAGWQLILPFGWGKEKASKKRKVQSVCVCVIQRTLIHVRPL